jgi:ATP-dependent helicase/nuclease subunit A
VSGAEPAATEPNPSQRGATDPTASVWVSASAGTGKTKVLTDRVLSLLLANTPPHRILCITYTKAAAAQMNAILTDRLGKWTIADDEALRQDLISVLGRAPDESESVLARRLFALVLDSPGGLNILTIHAFCQSLLSRFPLEAGIAPHFSVVDERDAGELLAAAREEVLLRARGDGGDLAEALAEVTRHVDERGFTGLFQSLTDSRGRLAAVRERLPSVAAATAAIHDLLGLAPDETAERIAARASAEGAFDAAGLRAAAAALAAGSRSDQARADVVSRWVGATAAERARRFDAYAEALLTKGEPPTVRRQLITKAASEKFPRAAAVLEQEAERLLAVVFRRRAAVTAAASSALLVLGTALLEAYQRQKDARALLDYDDLIVRTSRLLEREGGASWVLYKLDGGIDHVLIDEAQDTSPDQWRIIRALTAEFFAGEGARRGGRTIFVVGDVKQSIFSFQGADPDAFLANRQWFDGCVRGAGQIWRQFGMQVSYRSTRAVLAAVNDVFATREAAEGVALDGMDIQHQVWRQREGGAVEVWPPLEPRQSDPGEPWKPPIERVAGDSPEIRLAGLVARRIAAMTDGSERLPAAGRPIEPGDIMVLVRRRTAFVEELVRKLKERNVPVAGVDRMVLSEQMAVMDLVALARFVLLPSDDLNLATVLKGPLIGLEEEQLFRLAYGRRGSLWHALAQQRGEEPAFAEAYHRLHDLLSVADFAPPFEFFARVLGPLGGRRKLLARLGRDAEDPLTEFLDLALTYERHHAASLQGFLAWLTAGRVEVKRDLEQAPSGAVRIMTVHGAKGLQAPIVFLPDTLQVPRDRAVPLWAEAPGGRLPLWPPRKEDTEPVTDGERRRAAARQRQEYRRLMYVAMTRARDRLIVCGWRGKQKEPDDCWYHLIRRSLEAASPGNGLERVEDRFLAAAPEIDDAQILRLTCPQEGVPPPPQAPAPTPPSSLPPWVRQPAPAEPDPPRPLTPSRPTEDEPPVLSPLAGDGGFRFRRGRLIHRLLQSLPEIAAANREAAARAWLDRPAQRLDRASADEIVREVLAVLAHPDLAPMFGPGSQAEVPLAGAIAGRVVSGQVDRLLVADREVTVLDYKSNRPAPRAVGEVPAIYLRQMAAYREALRAVYPGRAVRCVLLWTDGPLPMVLPDRLLDAYAP